MSVGMDGEYAGAVADLKNRFDRAFVERMGRDLGAGLLEHFRTREMPKLFFSNERLGEIARLSRAHDPEEHAWEKKIADHAREGRIYGASNAYCDRFVAVDRETFDFSTYEHHDPEAIHGMGRHRWYASLARTYWDACDASYFEALMREWDFYWEVVPEPDDALMDGMHTMGGTGLRPPYGELDIFIRLTNWWWAFWLTVPAKEMTPERCVILLSRCLKLFDLVAARGIKIHEHNFTSMQLEAISFWATALPEVNGMRSWLHMARNSLESSLNRAVFADGWHWEKSISYHCGCVRWYGSSFHLGRLNGRTWSEAYGERLLKMGEAIDAVVSPDGKMPLMSDSDRIGTWANSLALLRCAFPDVRFENPTGPTYFSLWLSDGATWDPEAERVDREPVRVFPDGGVGTGRNRATGSLVILDNGPTKAGHSHKDNMTVHYDALGKVAIVDPGRWVYRRDDDRVWVNSVESHNTVYIEDTPIAADERIPTAALAILADTDDVRIGKVTAAETEGALVLATSFSGYTADPMATARRTVAMGRCETAWLAVVDTVEAPEAHTWTHSWLFPSEHPIERDGDGYLARLYNGLVVRFAVTTDGELEMRDDLKFWCPNYGEKEPARWVRFSGRTKQSVRGFAFAVGEGEAERPAMTLGDGSAVVEAGSVTAGFTYAGGRPETT